MKTIQLDSDDIQAIDGEELTRLLRRCYVPRPTPRRKAERDDLFGDMELLHGKLTVLAELHARLLRTPHD